VDELYDCGVLTAVCFILQAMQSGLTGLDPENRLIKLYQHVYQVSVILQDYIYNMVDQSLIHLNGSHNCSLNR